MSATVFVDTNVLIYALDRADLKKQERARAWRTKLWERKCGRISFQVLQEFYANVVRKWPSASELVSAAAKKWATLAAECGPVWWLRSVVSRLGSRSWSLGAGWQDEELLVFLR